MPQVMDPATAPPHALEQRKSGAKLVAFFGEPCLCPATATALATPLLNSDLFGRRLLLRLVSDGGVGGLRQGLLGSLQAEGCRPGQPAID